MAAACGLLADGTDRVAGARGVGGARLRLGGGGFVAGATVTGGVIAWASATGTAGITGTSAGVACWSSDAAPGSSVVSSVVFSVAPVPSVSAVPSAGLVDFVDFAGSGGDPAGGRGCLALAEQGPDEREELLAGAGGRAPGGAGERGLGAGSGDERAESSCRGHVASTIERTERT